MPEYTYDPALGDAVETRGGVIPRMGNAYEQSHSSLGATQEEIARHQLNETAAGLGSRAAMKDRLSGVSDSDIDSSSFAPQLVELEQELQYLQTVIYQSTSPVEKASLSQRAESLAAQIVSLQQSHLSGAAVDDSSIANDIREEVGNLEAQEVLQFAAENLQSHQIEELNQNLESEDPLTVEATWQFLQQYRSNPAIFSSDRSDFSGFDDYQFAELVQYYGEERASEISLLGQAVAAGVKTPSQVLRTASQDPALLQTILDAAQRGLIRIQL